MTTRRARAFTLLELIVVIVVLGVLTAIAIPTFQALTARTQAETGRATVAAILRDTQALMRLNDTEWSTALATAATETTAAPGPATLAASFRIVPDDSDSDGNPTPDGIADAAATSWGELSWATYGSALGVAAVTDDGTAVYGYLASETAPVLTWTETSGTPHGTVALDGGPLRGGDEPTPPAPDPATAPTDVIPAGGDSHILLSWAPNPDGEQITAYTVTYGPAGGATATMTVDPDVCAAGPCQVNIGGLTNGVDYTLTVTATNPIGLGPPSATVQARPTA